MPVRSTLVHLAATMMMYVLATSAAANVPPGTPTITEPATDNRILNSEDVHMETGPFVDADIGDTHICTDWEIWTVTPLARVWGSLCSGGIERLHTHLGDGVFEGSHAGRLSLLPLTSYQLRIRHRDSSPDLATQWSAFAVRPFSTAALSAVLPMNLRDISTTPTPTLADTSVAAIVLPGGATAASIRIETGTGQLLLEFRGQDNMMNLVTNPAALAAHGDVRAVIAAGSAPLALPDANITFTDENGAMRTVYLPAVNLGINTSRIFWVADNGATFNGAAGQTTPTFAILARGAAAPWTTRQPGFKVDVVASGFQLPVAIAFVNNAVAGGSSPLCYVAELYGSIKLVRGNGEVSTYASNLLNFNPTGFFPGTGEQGLGGICIDPISGDVFATMLYDSAPPNGAHYPKVVRFHSTDGGLTAATQTIILDMVGATQGQSHQISNITIGPDGKLYVHNGDGFDAASAQNNTSFKGKILRMNLDGTPVVDNPFTDGPPFTPIDYIYASGVRNPFGGAWRSLDGAHYIAENGPSVDRLSKLVRARNYLWDGSDASMANFAIYNWAPSSGPVAMTFIQSATFGGSGFPATLYGRGYVTESGATWATGTQTIGKRISEFNIDASGTFPGGPLPFIEYNGSGKATCAGLAAGPDGLYFTDLYKDQVFTSPIDPGANLLRIKYVGFAAIIASTTTAETPPLTVQFTDASTVPSAFNWFWTFGDGATSTLRNPSHTYTQNGQFTVRLTVTGAGGSVSVQRNALIRIGQPPAIAVIGGTNPPSATDLAVANHLRSLGYLATSFDDEPANRPGASQLATDFGLVVVSSSINSGNVAGEFRGVNVPMIFWESAMLRTGRESLSDNGITLGTQTQITITNNTHPVTQGVSLGNLTVYNNNQTLSIASGAIGSGAITLATRLNTPTQPSVLVAETGASLVGGYIAPARRVFLFFDDTSFSNSNAAAKTILNNSVCWAMNLSPRITTQPASVAVGPGLTATLTVTAAGLNPRSYQWRKAGVPVVNSARITGAMTTSLQITNTQASDSGSYDVLITNSCGNITTTAATLTVSVACPADINNSGSTTVQDIFDFLSAYFANLPSGDFNNSGAISVQDIFDFLSAYFVGCP